MEQAPRRSAAWRDGDELRGGSPDFGVDSQLAAKTAACQRASVAVPERHFGRGTPLAAVASEWRHAPSASIFRPLSLSPSGERPHLRRIPRLEVMNMASTVPNKLVAVPTGGRRDIEP